MSRVIASAALVFVAWGGVPAGAAGQEQPERRRSTPSLITAEEIAERTPTAQHAMEIVERLRPQWLRPRRGAAQLSSGGATVPQLQTYLQGIRQPSTDALRTIHRESIYEIKFLSGVDASVLYGLDHELGAILVRTSPPG